MQIQINAAARLCAAAFSASNAAKLAENICEAADSNSADATGKTIEFTGTPAALKSALTKLGYKYKDDTYQHKTRSWLKAVPGKVKGTLKISAVPNSSRLKASADNGDRERLDQLVKQIKMFEEDVKEIEDEGDDATTERKHLESLRDEQRRLKEKVGTSHARTTT